MKKENVFNGVAAYSGKTCLLPQMFFKQRRN
jgi:hypothetical protein